VAQPVRAPAYRLSAERENDELVGKAPLKPAASLASPWPIRSWSWFQGVPWRALSTLALAAVSRKLTSVMTSTGTASCPSTAQPGQLGQYNPGRPPGRAPTTRPPLSAKPSQWLKPAEATTISSTEGKAGFQRRTAISRARLPRPNASEGRCRARHQGPSTGRPAQPSRLPNCEPTMSTAAACVKAMSTGAFTRLSNQPNRTSPSTTCSRPDSSVSHTASETQSADPGVASPASDALTSRQVMAVGPTDRRCDAPNSTATSAGSIEA